MIITAIESNSYLFQIAEIQSLVSEKMDIWVLGKEYSADDYIYQSKIKVDFLRKKLTLC